MFVQSYWIGRSSLERQHRGRTWLTGAGSGQHDAAFSIDLIFDLSDPRRDQSSIHPIFDDHP